MATTTRSYPGDPGACLFCSEMQPTGRMREYPTTGRTQEYECERGCSSEHRAVQA